MKQRNVGHLPLSPVSWFSFRVFRHLVPRHRVNRAGDLQPDVHDPAKRRLPSAAGTTQFLESNLRKATRNLEMAISTTLLTFQIALTCMPCHHPLLPTPSTDSSSHSLSGNAQFSYSAHLPPTLDKPICRNERKIKVASGSHCNNPFPLRNNTGTSG